MFSRLCLLNRGKRLPSQGQWHLLTSRQTERGLHPAPSKSKLEEKMGSFSSADTDKAWKKQADKTKKENSMISNTKEQYGT